MGRSAKRRARGRTTATLRLQVKTVPEVPALKHGWLFRRVLVLTMGPSSTRCQPGSGQQTFRHRIRANRQACRRRCTSIQAVAKTPIDPIWSDESSRTDASRRRLMSGTPIFLCPVATKPTKYLPACNHFQIPPPEFHPPVCYRAPRKEHSLQWHPSPT
jgi:hypothetical protein